MTRNQSYERNWSEYYKKTYNRPPRLTAKFALQRFNTEYSEKNNTKKNFVIDLGCGGGRDTFEFLKKDWKVLAVDSEIEAIKFMQNRKDLPPEADLTFQIAKFQEVDWLKCDLVNSSFALPLMSQNDFYDVWENIKTSLNPGGRIACQLFGHKDEWSGRSGMTFHERASIFSLLKGFQIEMLLEEKVDSETVLGKRKLWHLFHLVARKNY
ncbi:MAG: SAM-dependent methyltransferase [Alphaproteobacteria bacterium]|nr:SAM-dependent methyltransferase [Alphaproteobacteria bacterium]PPR14695.1 MAG: hypothetical protein CFH42_00454 [Alphaproteobacteria bacterium MarineAlpha12_Bin1]|tara:strand:- start:29625 stop:30254 length:630 start_codon:yes stop_codon:yes gene_type:complete